VDNLDAIIQKLEDWFAHCDSAVIALSGGVDSSLVAYLARKWLGAKGCLAVIGDSASLKQRDLVDAKLFCEQNNIPFITVKTHEMRDEKYTANPSDRCYFCKHELFCQLEFIRREQGYSWILGGENIDDAADYRPGMTAAREFHIKTPLMACGLNKEQIRALCRHFNLNIADKPASPCLSSRIPYGAAITESKLSQIEKAENYLADLGFDIVRVRHLGATARIEVLPEKIPDLRKIVVTVGAYLLELGFEHVEIDDEGFVSGKLNRSLKAAAPEEKTRESEL
jgi:uncharacterized protein